MSCTLSSGATFNSAQPLAGARRQTLIAQGPVVEHASCAATATSPGPAARACRSSCALLSAGIKRHEEDGGTPMLCIRDFLHSDAPSAMEAPSVGAALQALSLIMHCSAMACRAPGFRLAAYGRAPRGRKSANHVDSRFQVPAYSLQESSQRSFSWKPAPSWLV